MARERIDKAEAIHFASDSEVAARDEGARIGRQAVQHRLFDHRANRGSRARIGHADVLAHHADKAKHSHGSRNVVVAQRERVAAALRLEPKRKWQPMLLVAQANR